MRRGFEVGLLLMSLCCGQSAGFAQEPEAGVADRYRQTLKSDFLTMGRVINRSEGEGEILAISPDAETYVTIDQTRPTRDGAINAWLVNVPSPAATFVTGGAFHTVNTADISPDQRFLVSGSEDHTIRVWDFKTAQPVTVLEQPGFVYAVRFDPSGKHLASGGSGKIDGPSQPLRTLLQMFGARSRHYLKLWSVPDWKLVRSFIGHEDSIGDIEFSRDGQTMASSSLDGTVRLWDLRTGKMMRVLNGPGGYLSSVDYAPNGRYLAAVSYAGTGLVWDLQAAAPPRALPLDGVRDIAFLGQGTLIVTMGFCDVALWDAATGNMVQRMDMRAPDHSCKEQDRVWAFVILPKRQGFILGLPGGPAVELLIN